MRKRQFKKNEKKKRELALFEEEIHRHIGRIRFGINLFFETMIASTEQIRENSKSSEHGLTINNNLFEGEDL